MVDKLFSILHPFKTRKPPGATNCVWVRQVASKRMLPVLATQPRGVPCHKVGRPARPGAGRQPWRKGEKRLTPGRLREGRWEDSETWGRRGAWRHGESV